jgi:regulator of sigma E protease
MPSVATIAAIVLFLGGLIFVHELGHFLVAKAFGVKVVRFSIGFGPRLFGFTRGETEYWIAAFPLGGYVKMAGDLGDDPEKMPPEDRGRGYLDQSPWKRLGISVAGPAMNLIFPFFVYLALAISEQGHPVAGPTIGMVLPGSAAAVAGLRPGDRILSVTAPGGPARPVRRFGDLREMVSPHPDEPLVFRVQRDGQELPPLTITPAPFDDHSSVVETVRRGVLGVSAQYAPALVAPARPGVAGPLQPFDLVVSAAGKPIRTLPELERAVAAARCAPIELEVVREDPIPLPGVTVSSARAVPLHAVPTCSEGGAPAFLPADQSLSTFVAAVEPGGPAERAGIRRGDAIVSINGKPVHTLADINRREIGLAFGDPERGGPPPEVKIGLADGRTVTLVATAQKYVDELTRDEKTRYLPGFQGDDRARGVNQAALTVEQVPLERTPAEMVGAAWEQTAYVVRVIFKGIVKLLTGQASIKNVGGPFSIIHMAKEAAEEGVSSFFFLMGVISVNLALMNLLPIPVLDGGNIAQALLEGITRRPLSPRTRMVAQAIGLALLVTLMIVVFGNDIARIVGGKG